MIEIFNLTKRHIKNYYRDKGSVFFSFLSVIILFSVFFLFLNNIYNNIEFESEIIRIRFMVGSIMGAVLVVNTLTLSLGVIGNYVNDTESKKINGLLILPVSRWKLVISYFMSTIFLTLALTSMMFFLTAMYLGYNGFWFPLSDLLIILLTIIFYIFISVPLVMIIISFIRTNSAFGTVSSIIGTIIGFVSGIYVPLSVLDPITRGIATVLPFSHMTVHMRRLLIGEDIYNKLPNEAMDLAGLNYLNLFGFNVNILSIFIIFSLVSLSLLYLSYYKINRKVNN